ncbi:hypothetical protein MKS88_005213 [Plasmodium brasilianum]|uniref:Uncharacterized protein n=1 Tax=Plasmodium brasilianum TaxID=5824 RepID=A0ACB9Y4U8_PLABR|nr:hypothetical protein MKS88_005213 [Plasmodium brasilianum]
MNDGKKEYALQKEKNYIINIHMSNGKKENILPKGKKYIMDITTIDKEKEKELPEVKKYIIDLHVSDGIKKDELSQKNYTSSITEGLSELSSCTFSAVTESIITALAQLPSLAVPVFKAISNTISSPIKNIFLGGLFSFEGNVINAFSEAASQSGGGVATFVNGFRDGARNVVNCAFTTVPNKVYSAGVSAGVRNAIMRTVFPSLIAISVLIIFLGIYKLFLHLGKKGKLNFINNYKKKSLSSLEEIKFHNRINIWKKSRHKNFLHLYDE